MEKHLGRVITKKEHIHHIDFNRQNNNIDNLYVCSISEHAQIHCSLEKVIQNLISKNLVKFQNGEYVLATPLPRML